jgi:predicted amidohydrolase YtcJ
MCVACVPGLLAALQSISSPSRRQFLKGSSALAVGGPFIAEAVAPNSGLADGGMNSDLAKGLRGDEPPEPTAAARIYMAKKVVTMERNNPTAAAVAVLGKRILAVGTLDQVKSAVGTRSYTVNDALKSKVVMPGFIDQHLHPVLGALTLAVEVIATEDWVLPDKIFKAANSQSEYQGRLRAAEVQLNDPDEWLLTWGYQPLWHGRLDRETLDAISSTRPIAVWHRSCHELFFNAAGLKALGMSEEMTNGRWWRPISTPRPIAADGMRVLIRTMKKISAIVGQAAAQLRDRRPSVVKC